jgi:hypothetical protein
VKRLLSGLVAAGLVAGSATAAELTLTLGGDFYEGAPSYEILADGIVVATGTVASERDDVVSYEVGEPSSLAIRFTNDLVAPKGPDGVRPAGADRNLIIQSVAYGGRTIPGWELAGAPGVARMKGFANVSIKQTVDIPVSASIVEAAAPVEASLVETASVPDITVAPSASGCEPMEVHLTGYDNGKMLPTPRALAALDEVFTAHGCRVIITGYSSQTGSAAGNKKMAQLRAEAILDYLLERGAEFSHVDVAGWGETDLFGSDDAANRRVVVSVQ